MNKSIKLNIQPLVDEVYARMRAQFSGYPENLINSLDQLILTERVQIRPKITLLIGNMFSVEQEDLINLAAAVEMLHIATQIHNELVDQSSPSNADQYIFITSATVLTGDLAFAAAAQLAAAANNIAIMQKFSETLQFIVNGEITYLFRNGNHDHLEAYYNRIHSKSASIFEIATGMAATIGSANEAEIKSAFEFGFNLGMAYQILNDVHAFSGNGTMLDKQEGNERQQSMLTLPTILYQKMYPETLAIQTLTKRNGNNKVEIEELIKSIRQSKAIDQAIQEAKGFLENGLESLFQLPESQERYELERITKFEVQPNGLM